MLWSLDIADQGNLPTGQGQFSAFTNAPCQDQDTLGGATNISQFVSPEVVELTFLQHQAGINNYGTAIL